MKGQSISMQRCSPAALLFMLVFFAAAALAQVPVDENGNTLPATYEGEASVVVSPAPAVAGEVALLSAVELQELVGPVALYPDDLLAIVLPASAYPLEIVQAARFLEALQTDDALEPDEAWDESVVALLNYPDVVRLMDEDIEWTWRLGDAVITQQTEVIAAVEAFRDRAYAAGNLKSDEYQNVSSSEGIIEIVPVNEEIIYVPYYEPAEVVVYQPRRVYNYYPDPYPVYYYPYPAGYRFHSNYFWGVTTAFNIGWSNHFLHVYHPTYWGHPYYGRSYAGHYYRRPSINVYNTWYVSNNRNSSAHRYRDGDYWRPRTRAGARQQEPRVRNEHYPPNRAGDSRSTGANRANARGDDRRLEGRQDGRISLNLRERDAGEARVLRQQNARNTAGNRTARQSVRNTEGSAASQSRALAQTANRSTPSTANDRRATATGERSQRPANNAAGRGERENTTSPRSSDTDVKRQSESRPDIRFRDRGSDNGRTAPAVAPAPSGRTSAPAGNRGATRLTDNARRDVSATRQNRNRSITSAAQPGAETNRAVTNRSATPDKSVSQRQAPRTERPQVRASQPSTPQVNRSSGVQRSAPASRVSAPRVSQSAPAPRAAPQRSAAPRSAPQRATPRATRPQQRAAPRQQQAPAKRSGSREARQPRNRN